MAFVLFSAMKNEAPFLLEWVAYHRAIGFDRIIVASNDCTDGTAELLDALQDAGAVEHLPQVLKRGVSAQNAAAQLAREKVTLAEGDWAIWLDADEMLNIHAGAGKMSDLAEAIGSGHGMFIAWRLFGDSSNPNFPGRFISDDFLMAASRKNTLTQEGKMIFRQGPAFEGFSKRVHRPALAANHGLAIGDFLSGEGKPLNGKVRSHRRWIGGDNDFEMCAIDRRDFGWAVAQINHYCVRTPEHYTLKRLRGRGFRSGQAGDKNTRHTDDFYTQMNANEQTDRSILRHAEATSAEIARLRQVPAVLAAERKAALLVGLALSGNEPAKEPRSFELALPRPERRALKGAYARAKVILEYGAGAATLHAAAQAGKVVFTVDSDPVQIADVSAALAVQSPEADVRLHLANIGPTGPFGRPLSAASHRLWSAYPHAIWDAPDFQHPDVVLIDGRFRTACFATVAMRITKPVTVLFDDFADRPEYHWITALAPAPSLVGRMAVFRLKPRRVPQAMLGRIADSYSNPN